MAIAVAQFTIFDFHDVQSSPTPPSNPVKEQIWLDTSVHPPFMKVWDGNKWVIANDYSNDINNNKVTIQTHTTDISVIKGNITTLIKDTTIVKDGKTVLLKDDYNRTVQTVDSMKSTIGNHTTQINQATGDITKVESKVNTVERNLDSITARVSSTETNVTNIGSTANNALNKANETQNSLNSKEDKNYRVIYARGTGNDYPGNAIVKIGNEVLLNGQGRGLNIIALNPNTLTIEFRQVYDTFGDSNARVNFNSKIEELNNGNFIIIITSQDASYPLNVKSSLEKIGATLFTRDSNTYREAYALIGKSKLGKGNGIEMFIPKTSLDKRFADIAVKVEENGAFSGTNSNNTVEALNQVSQEITETKNKVSGIEVNLASITSRVSSVETTTSTINGQVSNLSTRMNSAEQKITDSSIVATVSSQFYKKGEADSRYANKTQISQLENQITTAVETFETRKIGTYNMIKNPTALLNKDKWGAFLGANCKIERVSINIESIKELPTKIHFIDIGDGLCVLVESNGKFALIDTGKLGTAINKGSLEYIKSLGVEDIDYFIITHHHSDHNGECERFLNNFNVKNVYTRQPDWSKMPAVETGWQTKVYFDRFYNKLKSQGKDFSTPTERQTLWMSNECALEIFNTGFNNYAEYNDLSFGVLVRVGARRLFIAGDISYNAEAALRGKVGKVDYLCGGHHAYNTSNSDAWLSELNPTTCIFTSENIRGSSQSTVVNRVKNHGIEVYSTDLDGTIVVTMDSKNISHNATHAV